MALHARRRGHWHRPGRTAGDHQSERRRELPLGQRNAIAQSPTCAHSLTPPLRRRDWVWPKEAFLSARSSSMAIESSDEVTTVESSKAVRCSTAKWTLLNVPDVIRHRSIAQA